MTRTVISIAVLFVTIIVATAATAQTPIKLIARKASDVELVYGKRSVIFDLDKSLYGTNGTLPGEPPHKIRMLYTAEKDGSIYAIANIRSGSPISNPMAPCGGDSPQAILWIKADKTLKKREVQSEIYASCSYNYYDSKVKKEKNGLKISYGGEKKLELKYDNDRPENGLVITKLSSGTN